MDNYTEIRNKIRAMTGQKTPLLLTGKVESVDSEKCTCTVTVGDHDGLVRIFIASKSQKYCLR